MSFLFCFQKTQQNYFGPPRVETSCYKCILKEAGDFRVIYIRVIYIRVIYIHVIYIRVIYIRVIYIRVIYIRVIYIHVIYIHVIYIRVISFRNFGLQLSKIFLFWSKYQMS